MTYTQEELDEFRELVEDGESQHQLRRIHSRLQMPRFIEKVGRAKCDEMFLVLKDEYNNRGEQDDR
jgi:hypothetical protein